MNISSRSSNRRTLDSVQNSIRVLKSFSIDNPVQHVMELSRSLDIDKSTVSRILSTLADEGLVIKDKNSRGYRLGPVALALGTTYKNSNETYLEAKSVLKSLVTSTGETAQLGILDGLNTFVVDSMESKHQLRVMSFVGSYSPIHCSSLGKVMLAYRNENLIEEVIQQGLNPWTSNTITDEDMFRKEIMKIKKQGYAISNGEKFEEILGIAAPIRNQKGEAIAAVNVVGPVWRLQRGNLNRCIRILVNAADEISKELNDY